VAGAEAQERVERRLNTAGEGEMVGGRTLGLILLGAGLGLLLAVALWVGAGVASHKYEDLAAPALGIGAAFIFGTLPLGAVGLFLLVKGRAEEKEMARVRKERELLNMVLTRGQVDIASMSLELNVGRDELRHYIYDLVGKGLFTGYVNWDRGMLYSRQVAEMPSDRCPNCGGQLELAGKGVVRCPYCGSEIFLRGG
jgi:DNA-directed RNA polymerase subunit RPC12/RpoP